MVEPLIEARDLHFAYRKQSVVTGVSISVRGGEMVGVLGPNGSGKSTLVRLLSGVLHPTRGEVALLGRPLASYAQAERARTIAVVPQETFIAFPFSVMEVVLMGRAPHLPGIAFESANDVMIARAAMERTDVAHLASRSIHELSGGERQRVILARALAQQARVLLLDEPTAFLDLRHQIDIYDLLRNLLEEGTAIITVLHDLNLAAMYCDRLVLLKAGTLVVDGPLWRVLDPAVLEEVYEIPVAVEPGPGGVPRVYPRSLRGRQ